MIYEDKYTIYYEKYINYADKIIYFIFMSALNKNILH